MKEIFVAEGSSSMYRPHVMNPNSLVFSCSLASFVATLLLVGCGAAPAKETSKLPESTLPTTKPDAETTVIARSKGLVDAANDPNIVKAFKDVLACPWNADEDRFDAECPAVVAFGENENLLGEDEDKGVLTLLNLLDDPDEKVRSLALDKMPFSGAKAYTDKALASRIVAQAERETTERCASNFGSLVGRIDLKATGLIGPVKRLVETHPNVAMRKSILGSILYKNDKDRDAVDLVLAGLKSDNKDIRYTCVLNLSKAQGSFAAEVCPVYVTMLDDSSPDVVGLSAQNLGYVGKCTGQIDALLAFASKRAAAGGEKLFLVANALGNLCDNAATSEAQKKEAAKVAKAFALGKNDSTVRTDALYGVTSCDPSGAEAFLKGLLKDPDERVKKSAQERLGKLKKK